MKKQRRTKEYKYLITRDYGHSVDDNLNFYAKEGFKVIHTRYERGSYFFILERDVLDDTIIEPDSTKEV